MLERKLNVEEDPFSFGKWVHAQTAAILLFKELLSSWIVFHAASTHSKQAPHAQTKQPLNPP